MNRVDLTIYVPNERPNDASEWDEDLPAWEAAMRTGWWYGSHEDCVEVWRGCEVVKVEMRISKPVLLKRREL